MEIETEFAIKSRGRKASLSLELNRNSCYLLCSRNRIVYKRPLRLHCSVTFKTQCRRIGRLHKRLFRIHSNWRIIDVELLNCYWSYWFLCLFVFFFGNWGMKLHTISHTFARIRQIWAGFTNQNKFQKNYRLKAFDFCALTCTVSMRKLFSICVKYTSWDSFLK